MPDPLPPMPLYIMQIQAAYVDLQMKVAEIIQSFDIFPQAAIMLAAELLINNFWQWSLK